MDINLLISKVYQKPEIWDSRVKEYSNHLIVDKSWQEIANEMGLKETAVRKKWKYLRDQFCVETGRAKVLRERGVTSQKPKWPHYQTLWFLKDIIKPRLNASQLKKLAKIEVVEQNMDLNKDEETQMDVMHSIESAIEDVINDTSRLKRQRAGEDSDCNEIVYDNIVSDRTTGLQVFEVIPSAQPENEDLLFFRSLMPYVNQIPDHLKLRFRNRVQELVEEFAFQS